ncbi:MAG: exo-alpha-sialidase [Pseudomonadota bacterium]
MLNALFCLLGLLAASQAGAQIAVETPAAAGSAQPRLTGGRDGLPLVLSWLDPQGDGVALRFAVLRDGRFSAPRTVASGNDWFVNWADFPSVTPVSELLWGAHWLVKRPGGPYAYDVMIARSSDGGETFGRGRSPHQDGTATEHGFVSLFALGPELAAVWLDGRKTGGGHSHDNHHTSASGPMTLRWGRSSGRDPRLSDLELDARVCDCCPTAAAPGPAGPLVVYRNRTEDEIRDIYLTRWVDGRWLPGKPVADDRWQVAGCPVNGPAIDARQDQVAVAWFTAADDQPRVQLARSGDGGASFTAATTVDAENPVGRVDVALTPDGRTWVSWLRDDGTLVVREADAAPDEAVVISRAGASRLSGMPQLQAVDNQLWLAWTQVVQNALSGQTSTQVKAAVFTPPAAPRSDAR